MCVVLQSFYSRKWHILDVQFFERITKSCLEINCVNLSIFHSVWALIYQIQVNITQRRKELWFSPHSSLVAHSQENGILQGWLISLNRPYKISMLDLLDHNAKGTALIIATSTCLSIFSAKRPWRPCSDSEFLSQEIRWWKTPQSAVRLMFGWSTI